MNKNKELEAMINKALSEGEEANKKQKEKEKEPLLTSKDLEDLFEDKEGDYRQPWQRIHNK